MKQATIPKHEREKGTRYYKHARKTGKPLLKRYFINKSLSVNFEGREEGAGADERVRHNNNNNNNNNDNNDNRKWLSHSYKKKRVREKRLRQRQHTTAIKQFR